MSHGVRPAQRRSLVLALALIGCMARGAAAQVPETWVGSWTLNVARSSYPSAAPPYRRASYRIERTGDSFRVIYDMVHPRGGTTHLEWTGRTDGRDYPLQGVDQVITYAYTPTGGDGCDIVVKIDGRVAARSRVTLSDGGRTMITTTTSAGPGGVPSVSTTIYERQPDS